MKRSKLLIALLAVSLSVNAFMLFSGFEPQTGCPEISGYTQPAEISNGDANKCIDNYKNNAGEGALTGGVISGSAIKEMFCAAGTNGLTFTLAQDPDGVIAEGGVFVVLTGANVEATRGEITKLTRTGTRLLRNNNWCPPNCVAIPK